MPRDTFNQVYPLNKGETVIRLPKGAIPFFAEKRDMYTLALWVSVTIAKGREGHIDEDSEDRVFVLYAPGELFDGKCLSYVATVRDAGFIWFIYERIN